MKSKGDVQIGCSQRRVNTRQEVLVRHFVLFTRVIGHQTAKVPGCGLCS